MNLKNLSFLFLIALFLLNCKKKNKDEEPQPTPSPLPVVSTSAISSIGPFSAIGGGNVSSEGTSAITKVGVCWDVNPNPTTLKPNTNNGAGVGTFTSVLSGLGENVTYYVRAYATNASGTAYGNEVSFKTFPAWSLTYTNNPNYTCFAANDLKVFAGGTTGVIYSGDNGLNWVATGITIPVRTLLLVDTVLYVATTANGIYKTSNNGVSFAPVNNGLTNMNVYGMAVIGNTILAGTPSGVFKSADNGQSWSTSSSGLSNLSVNAMAAKNNKFYAGTWGGLFVSTDFGTSWTSVSGAGTDVNSIAVNGNYVLTSTFNNGGIYSSADDGQSFTIANTGLSITGPIALTANANKVYCGSYMNSGVFMSINGGAGWTAANEGLNGMSVYGLGANSNYVFVSIFNSGIYRRSAQ
ncbi:MAG: hypothetical protein IPM51_10885 [Sphingobacteriaceae bacterium]|nr:hypothetical protein [Sphingobacteriaceae bacterium]